MQFLALCQEHYAVWSGNIHVAKFGILCSILAGSLVDGKLTPAKKSIHRLVKSLPLPLPCGFLGFAQISRIPS